MLYVHGNGNVIYSFVTCPSPHQYVVDIFFTIL